MVVVIIIMGAAGAGKTTIGRALAAALGWPFVDADDQHPAHNIEKMRAGVPLTDADRAPWIGTLRAMVERAIDRREHTVLACSALKERDRHTLRAHLRSVRFVYLHADRGLLERRLAKRPSHFFGPALVSSQLADLEEPDDALIVERRLAAAADSRRHPSRIRRVKRRSTHTPPSPQKRIFKALRAVRFS